MMKSMGPSNEPCGAPYMSCDGDEDELLTEVDWYLSERCDWKHWSAKNRVQAWEENLVVSSVKGGRKFLQKERISFTIRNKNGLGAR